MDETGKPQICRVHQNYLRLVPDVAEQESRGLQVQQ